MSYSVLIADDSILMRTVLKKNIENCDLGLDQIFEVENGQQALDFLSSNTVDLILTDLNMPVMDGIEFTHRLKASNEHCNIPIIVITAESSTSQIDNLKAEGIDDFLHKPFTPEEFKAVLTRNLPASVKTN